MINTKKKRPGESTGVLLFENTQMPLNTQIPRIMGIVNVTPDSFSDGGLHDDANKAVAHALQLVSQGADWLDIGGESTRPGADPVSADDEIARTLPVITALRQRIDTPISIDTMKPEVARAAISAGARMWNDVSGGRFCADSLEVAADLDCELCLMHMQGEPRTMQANPNYEDVVADVIAFLIERANAAISAGVARDKIWIDPGIGFGKTLEHNLALIRATGRIIEETGFPMLFGASRKRFIAAIDETAADAQDRLGGSLTAALEAARQGAAILRVHDVRETSQALSVQNAILSDG